MRKNRPSIFSMENFAEKLCRGVIILVLVISILFLPASLARADPLSLLFGSDTNPNALTLTINVTANNGARTIDLKLAGIRPHPWCTDAEVKNNTCDSADLYGWELLDEEQGIPVASLETVTFTYTLPYGPYSINVCWAANVGGVMEAIMSGRLVDLESNTVVNFVVN